MMEHQGTVFNHSCIKMPVDPSSHKPTPSYERPNPVESIRSSIVDEKRKINFANQVVERISSPPETFENFLEFMESIPDYGDVNHLSNEQFEQKLDYLKRKQRSLLKNLRYCWDDNDDTGSTESPVSPDSELKITKVWYKDCDKLSLKGMKCSLEESRVESPVLIPFRKFVGLAEDQDLLTYRCKDKDAKASRNREIHSATKTLSTRSRSKYWESQRSKVDDSTETKSLPPNSPKKWHPTVPKPFNFTVREEAEKYMSSIEMQVGEEVSRRARNERTTRTKRHVRPVPLTSRLPMYNKLLAEKEERSRLVREESAWSLMSQVRPFRLECARRALTRSSPQLSRNDAISTSSRSPSRFKARPVPTNLFSTEVYDRMIEDDFYRNLTKRVRAAELLKLSSLPPSMAVRQRDQSVGCEFRNFCQEFTGERVRGGRESTSASVTPLPSERSRSAATTTSASTKGINLAAVLRCQASREKMEREIQHRMEERRREQFVKTRESIVRRRPAWRALRAAARYEHERDLALKASLRRDEARELAERHRLHMELMIGRVTQIPTLFERYSQNFGSTLSCPLEVGTTILSKSKKKKKTKKSNSESVDSYSSRESTRRTNSGSITSSASVESACSSSKSSDSRKSIKSPAKSINLGSTKKKTHRGPLKVSINETAELIEDNDDNDRYSSDSTESDRNNVSVTEMEENESIDRLGHKS